MMTGAILGGSSVSQAAKLQMVIMFMISASAARGAVSGIKAAELGGQLLAAAQDGKLDVRMVTEKLRGYWANSK